MYTVPFNSPEPYETLTDLKALPLFFSIDAYMNETSQLADHILPDTEYLERFGGFKTYPPVLTQVAGLRQPVVGTLDPVTHEYRGIHPDTRTADDILIMIAREIGLPGFGKDGGGPEIDINNSWDYWNLYYQHEDFEGEKGLAPDSRLVRMGGRFENPTKRYDGDYIRFPGGRQSRGFFVYSKEAASKQK